MGLSSGLEIREQITESRERYGLFSFLYSLLSSYEHFRPVCPTGYPVGVVAGLNLEGKAAGIVASPEGIR
jgi:hypothetical protein